MKTLIVSVDKAGHVNQCRAFCEHAGWRPDAVVRIPSPARMTGAWDRLALTARRRIATLLAAPRRRDPGRLRIVASGGAAEDVVARYRALYRDDLFALFSGRPRWPRKIFDVALIGRHSFEAGEDAEMTGFPAAAATVLRLGVMTRRIAGPIDAPGAAGLVALIGGLNKAFVIDAGRIVEQLAALSARRPELPLTIAFSRRTSNDVEQRLRSAFAARAAFVDRADRPGFEAAMAGATAFVVTPDSLTMACEACATGRPVHVFDLACFDPSASTFRLIEDLLARGFLASAPDGTARPCPAGAFEPPPQAVAAYRAWERTGRS